MLENILVRGRYKISENKISLFNGGSLISFKVKATSVTFQLSAIFNDCYIHIIKDLDYKNKEKYLIKNRQSLTINFHDSNKEHIIDLIKANEASNNNLIIENITVKGDILPYKPSKDIFIKVYGDSTIAGYGILAHDGNGNIHNNDSVENFCFRSL